MFASISGKDLKKVLKRIIICSTLVVSQVSRHECILRVGPPRSTVRIPNLDDRIGPMVDPHGESLLTTRAWRGMSHCFAISFMTLDVIDVVAYRWFALIFRMGPTKKKIFVPLFFSSAPLFFLKKSLHQPYFPKNKQAS